MKDSDLKERQKGGEKHAVEINYRGKTEVGNWGIAGIPQNLDAKWTLDSTWTGSGAGNP